MTDSSHDLGKLVAVHPIAPAFVQRAVFIAALSFLFFLTMMFTFYLSQNILYFLLASAFLVLYLVMMFALLMQRRSTVEVYERGLRFKNQPVAWSEIASVAEAGEIELIDSKRVILPRSLSDLDSLVLCIRSQLSH